MSDLEKFTNISLRRPRRGIYQQLLAGLLVKANNTNDPFIKILTICQAALMSKKKNKLDIDLVETCHTVTTSFVNTEVPGKGHIEIAWAFPQTDETWKKHIAPWQKIDLKYFPFQTPLRKYLYPLTVRYGTRYLDQVNEFEEWKEKVAEEVREYLCKMPPDISFFQKTAALSRQSFFAMNGEFEQWAIRNLKQIEAKISDEINPQIYREILGFAMGKELKQDGRKIGDSLGARE